jgi:predicted transcriptional regulator of viral defense system
MLIDNRHFIDYHKQKCNGVIMSTTLTNQFFAYIQMKEKEVLYLGELQSAFQISPKQEQDFLSKLSKKGSIIRLKRGVYLVPQKIPPGGKWQPDSLYIISHFMEVIGAHYYIGGLYAFNHYGLTTQLANQITIYNDRISAKKKLGTLSVQLIKISASRIGTPTIYEIREQRKINISSLPRTIVDAFIDWIRYNTLPTAFDWITKYLKDPYFLSDLIKTTAQYGNISSKRRIGYFLYQQTHDVKLVKPIAKTIKNSKGWLPLNPLGGTKGVTNKKWRIIDNVDS